MRICPIIIVCILGISTYSYGQTNSINDESGKDQKRKSIFDISGAGPVVGLFYYDLGIDDNNSSGHKKITPYKGTPPDPAIDYHSNAIGIRAQGQSSIIGGYCTMNDYKIILGEILNAGLTYGRISTNDASQENRYFLNTGSSWFVIDYELGFGFTTNFSADRQYGANFIITRGSLDRSFPGNGGRANSNTLLRYRYKRVLGEFELEGFEFGFKGLTNPKIIGLNCKILERKKERSTYHTPHFIGFGIEYMNTTVATVSETDVFKMLNLKVSVGKIF